MAKNKIVPAVDSPKVDGDGSGEQLPPADQSKKESAGLPPAPVNAPEKKSDISEHPKFDKFKTGVK